MTLLNGDCLVEIKKIPDNSVDLIYLDPPFFTQRKHIQKNKNNTIEYSFDDKWNDIQEYIEFMKIRLIEFKRVLSSTGSIFLHCDKKASHYLRVILDEIFGMDCFQSEIIWSYKRWSNSKTGLLNNHQNIYFYSKNKKFKFNPKFVEYSATTNVDQILQDRARNSDNKTTYKLDESGNIILGKAKKGVPLSDVWEIPYLNPKAKERTGYPTQKPILLLEQIIELVTDKGDVVLDPFCGSGTTLVAAKLLNRKYIGIDISKDAIHLTNERLENPVKTNSHLLVKGITKYNTKSDREETILKLLDAVSVQRNKGIDGFLKRYYKDKPIAVKIQKENESLLDSYSLLLKSANKKDCILKILIRTHSDYELLNEFTSIKDENLLIIDDYVYTIDNFIS